MQEFYAKKLYLPKLKPINQFRKIKADIILFGLFYVEEFKLEKPENEP